ncbi:proteasome subunit beta [Cutibacterium sp. WCA-380-WT-3A]|uniref:Proteasome subunit beta n=1 Tax=Cutibacterium porci TaxID=2605781 RepID=A0A7K0J6J8_9ACTN|nr:proteasome subunit beta [Cutibacterium porci]MSS45453.1 proteasome subunit beta [Cutibacterium porci]
MSLSLSDLDELMSSTSTDSFAVFLRRVAPELLPPTTVDNSVPELARHGRTVVAIRYSGGVAVAADLGSALARRLGQTDIDRILGTDDRCVIGIAGAAGLAGEMLRLFQAEVDHLEKIQAQRISMDGRAVRLSSLVRSNGTMMAQGLAVTPLLAGWDDQAHRGRIFSYDGTGGRTEEHSHACVGSGALFASGVLNENFRAGMDRDESVALAIRALATAISDDATSAASAPDLSRGLYPTVACASCDGVTRMPTEEVALLTKRVVDEMTTASDSGEASS